MPAKTTSDGTTPDTTLVLPGPALRADARRNRQRILDVAARVFADEGLAVPVQEIARRAGVGTGTVSRHFPTKEDLFEAILHQRMGELIAVADDLLARADVGASFFEFVEQTLHAAASDRGFAERLGTAIGHRDSFEQRVSADILCERLETLLDRAQTAGAVRRDVDIRDVEALMVACMTRPTAHAAMMSVIRTGLAA